MPIRYILTDIEGTTSSIAFVKDVLFPYSHERLADFVQANQTKPEVAQCLVQTTQTLADEAGILNPTEELLVTTLRDWITQDRKHTALKALQGMIWAEGFTAGHFTAHLYPDVAPSLRAWHALGLGLGIYSSGSIQAQRLYFSHTPAGDLTPLFDHYFDTTTGPKREAASYDQILAVLQLSGSAVLFLSDVPEELDAARAAGIQTCQLCRDGLPPAGHHPHVSAFDQIILPNF
jgi:enolase-phosphatase E1